MGCDGGTIPKRHELVKTKKKKEKLDKNFEIAAKWTYCALSNQPLKDPIVSCDLGRLYSKDAVIEYLLDKSGSKMDKMSHIKGLKDIHSLNLTINPSWQSTSSKGDGYTDDQCSRFICPVSGLEMNGRYKFFYLYPCGCVLSDRALKQVDENVCPSCSKTYSKENDMVYINPDKNEEEINRKNMDDRKLKLKAEKKRKKEDKKKFKNPPPVSNGNGKVTNGFHKDDKEKNSKPSTSTVSNKTTEKLSSDRVKNLTVTNTVKGAKRKMKEEVIFKSDAFKSLFTTHETAKRSKDAQSHWVTYNPYH